MKIKKIIVMIVSLILLQLSRIISKKLIFSFIDRTLLSDVIVNIIYIILIIGIIILILIKKKLNINIFPEKFNKKYIILTIVVFLFLLITPVITKNYEIFNILSLIYNSVFTVILEELIFRGIVFKELSLMKNEKVAYIVSTLLFGLWHLGYIDTIIWRTSLFLPNANILNIMFWKVIAGLFIGIVLGFFRYKNKNVYSSILVHTFINTIGS